MNAELDRDPTEQGQIILRIHLISGETYNQPLPIDEADAAQEFMDWYRDTKGYPVWSWQVPTAQAIHMLHRHHIIAVDINGYIEPDGRDSKWHERWMDKAKVLCSIYIDYAKKWSKFRG